MKSLKACLIILPVMLSFPGCHSGHLPESDSGNTANLETGFMDPPMSARPRAYWAWINGNTNLPRMTYELEEYKDKGFSGVDIFDIGAVDPGKVVPEGNRFLGKESVEAIAYALNEAKRLGLEMGLVASSSWNAGGDWVTPEYAAMLIYKSETDVTGPSGFNSILPFPEVSEQTPKNADGSPVFYKNVATIAFPVAEPGDSIPIRPGVTDLSNKMDRNGRLDWEVPEGKWKIMRLICSNSGQKLVLPSPKSAGYNIDHFNPEATEMHFRHITGTLKNKLGDLGNTALTFLYLCSYELKGLVWTPDLMDEFRKRRGYDMTPYLPVLFGYTVQTKDISARFMHDFRMTLSDLIIEGHYRKAREVSNENGLKLCSEAGGPGQPLHNCPFEALRALGTLDIPRGEFWNKHHFYDEKGEDILWLVKEIACASHIYGKKIVDGEAFTSWLHWQEGPFDLKPLADKAMCEGLNLFTFHTGTHNPPEGGKPGWVYHAGTQMNPNRIWWPMIRPFTDYLARSCYLLQQGIFVGDVCYYYGDNAPNFVRPKHVDPSLGEGYDYDVVNSEVILARMKVENGRLTLPDGMSYEILVLPEERDANPDVLRKIMELVSDGATVVGPKPERSYGLTGYPGRDEMVRTIAGELWGPCDGKTILENKYGKGRIIWGKSLREILKDKGVGPDFSFRGNTDSVSLDYIHRSTGDDEIYFISNRNMRWAEAVCEFRVRDKIPGFWIPETGEIRKIQDYTSNLHTTGVSVRLPPAGSVFVVFRGGNSNKKVTPANNENEVIVPAAMELTGPWNIYFPGGLGAPDSTVFPELSSWTGSKTEGIRYFSGIATYRKKFFIPDSLLGPDLRLHLDLGAVKMVADVYLNNHHAGILWKPPFSTDVSDMIVPGENSLVVKVANTWNNRIVGDQHLPVDKRFTSTNITSPLSSGLLWKKAPLLESGLLGPVKIIPSVKSTTDY
jgi:hypothetical protein